MKVAVLGFGTVGVGVYEMLGKAQGLEQGPVLVRPGKKDADFKYYDKMYYLDCLVQGVRQKL